MNAPTHHAQEYHASGRIERRAFVALMGATALAGGDALAQGTPKPGGKLRVSAQGNPSSLDPMTGNSGSDHVVLYPMYDTLVEWDYATLQAKPGIAESWIDPDPTTLVLTIRDGITFHDGTKCDAAAVRANLVRAMTHERSNIKSDLGTVKEITASGRNVTLKLKQPDSALPLILSDRAGMMCSPKAMEESGRDYDRKPVGAGGWKFVSWADNENVVMTRNEHYWKPGRPLADAVTFQVIPELNTGLRSVTAGQNDFIYFLVPQQKALIDRARNVSSMIGPTMWCIQMYINYGRPPLDNVKVRQALNFAVNRDEFNKAAFGGLAEPTTMLLPKAHWAHVAELANYYTHDPERARKLLAEGGYSNGIDLVGISYSEQLSVQQQEILIEQVRQAGIRLTFKRFTGPPTTTAFLAEKQGDVFLSAWTGRPDPSLTYQLMFGVGSYYNAGRGEGAPGLTEALLATRASSNLDVRKAAFRKLQQIVTEHALMVPLVFRPELDAFGKRVHGYRPNLLGKPKFTDVWLEG
ncbi:MAG: peptide ABC transporter [Acetobacteraceae bacterium]|nr:peptide ABC transporter [Acetobacteraceae bacterium]